MCGHECVGVGVDVRIEVGVGGVKVCSVCLPGVSENVLAGQGEHSRCRLRV